MNRRFELLSIVLFALGAAAVGGITSSLADVAGTEVDVGDLRGEILSLFAPLGAIATETNPNYKGAAAPAPAAPPSPTAADWPSYNKTLTSERGGVKVTEGRRHAARPPSRERRSMPRERATPPRQQSVSACRLAS
jgi:hypothetical protein